MTQLEELLLAEASICEYKETLELRRPKRWLKSVSAFANGNGGTLLFGVSDNREICGLADLQSNIDHISKQIKEHISPLPVVELTILRAPNDKAVLAVKVWPGDEVPYFYVANGNLLAYVRIGSDSVPAPASRLRELVLKGKNLSFDALSTTYRLEEMTFSALEVAFKRYKKITISSADLIAFGLCKPNGVLTNAGLLFADDCPLLQARIMTY